MSFDASQLPKSVLDAFRKTLQEAGEDPRILERAGADFFSFVEEKSEPYVYVYGSVGIGGSPRYTTTVVAVAENSWGRVMQSTRVQEDGTPAGGPVHSLQLRKELQKEVWALKA